MLVAQHAHEHAHACVCAQMRGCDPNTLYLYCLGPNMHSPHTFVCTVDVLASNSGMHVCMRACLQQHTSAGL